MPDNDWFEKVDLTDEERARNLRIFYKVAEAILVPVLSGILLGMGHWLTIGLAIVWWGIGVYGLLTDSEDFIVEIILRLIKI